jgi:hypothetical protein
VKCLSLFLFHHAVLEESFSTHSSFEHFTLLLIKTWELLELIFNDPSSLHHVLAELDKSHYILGGYFLW